MCFRGIIIAGITGTFMMTAPLYILSAITSKDPKDIFLGLVAHYAIGTLFSSGFTSAVQYRSVLDIYNTHL